MTGGLQNDESGQALETAGSRLKERVIDVPLSGYDILNILGLIYKEQRNTRKRKIRASEKVMWINELDGLAKWIVSRDPSLAEMVRRNGIATD